MVDIFLGLPFERASKQEAKSLKAKSTPGRVKDKNPFKFGVLR